jgi:hypothetical protein
MMKMIVAVIAMVFMSVALGKGVVQLDAHNIASITAKGPVFVK